MPSSNSVVLKNMSYFLYSGAFLLYYNAKKMNMSRSRAHCQKRIRVTFPEVRLCFQQTFHKLLPLYEKRYRNTCRIVWFVSNISTLSPVINNMNNLEHETRHYFWNCCLPCRPSRLWTYVVKKPSPKFHADGLIGLSLQTGSIRQTDR